MKTSSEIHKCLKEEQHSYFEDDRIENLP
jgi:hypothetical protein